jgi:antitoxin FitA
MEMADEADILVRKVSGATRRALKRRAKEHGRSTSAEIRSILDAVVGPMEKMGLGSRLAAFGRQFGGIELDIPPRTELPEPPSFE